MSERIRIGYVAKMFPRLSETFVLNEILELERQGVEVVVFSAKKPNEGRFHPQLAELKAPILYLEDHDPKKWAAWMSKDWEMHRPRRDRIFGLVDDALSRGGGSRVDRVWQGAWIAARAEELGIDRLHAHFATLPAMLAHMAHRVSGIPYSFTAHAKDIFVYSPEETRLPELISHADFMVTVTEYNRRHLLGLMPDVDPDRIRVVHNGIDLTSFMPVPEQERQPATILGVGRLVPKKGFDVLLRACVILRDRGVPFGCVVAGGGVDAEALANLHDELGLGDLVRFTGPLKVDRIRDLMREAAVFALPCQEASDGNLDALPTVLLESLASALPVVSTHVSGVPEIVTDGREGLLVPPEDPVALADALQRMLEDRSLRGRCGENGREKAETAFDIRRNVGRMHDLFISGGAAEAAPAADVPDGRRLLYVCADKGIPFGGTKGASIHVREFLDAATGAGHAPIAAVRRTSRADGRPPACRVVVLEAPDGVPASGDPALAECEEYARSSSFVGRLEDLHADAGFELVYERYSLFGVAGFEFARRAGLPFVLEVNAPLVQEAANHRDLRLVEPAREVERRLFRGADLVVAVSEAVRDYVTSVAPDARVEVVPNGVDTVRIAPAPATDDARARASGGAEDAFVVGFVGRIRPWHGVENLIDALALARRTAPDLRLCIVGDDGGLGDELRERSRECGVEEAVSFLGAVSPADVPGLLDAFDAFAAPYPALDDFYFSPLKVYEAMAAGKAVVASAAGQITDVIEDGRTGLLVEPGDVEALAAALVRLREEPGLAESLGAAAREAAVAEHDWRGRVETIMSLADGSGPRRVEAVS